MTEKNYLADYAKSFNWAGFFLPKIIYNDCSKLYSFCRILDNVVDEGKDLTVKTKKFNEIKNYFNNADQLNNEEKQAINKNEYITIVDDMSVLADNNKINLIIEGEEKQTGTVNAGVSLGTLDGFAIVTGLRERNFYGTGRSLDVLLNTSDDRNQFTFNTTDRFFLNDERKVTFKF